LHETVSITCYSASKATWTSWNNTINPAMSDNNTITIAIDNVRDTGQQTYSCQGTKEDNEEFVAYSKVNVGGKHSQTLLTWVIWGII